MSGLSTPTAVMICGRLPVRSRIWNWRNAHCSSHTVKQRPSVSLGLRVGYGLVDRRHGRDLERRRPHQMWRQGPYVVEALPSCRPARVVAVVAGCGRPSARVRWGTPANGNALALSLARLPSFPSSSFPSAASRHQHHDAASAVSHSAKGISGEKPLIEPRVRGPYAAARPGKAPWETEPCVALSTGNDEICAITTDDDRTPDGFTTSLNVFVGLRRV